MVRSPELGRQAGCLSHCGFSRVTTNYRLLARAKFPQHSIHQGVDIALRERSEAGFHWFVPDRAKRQLLRRRLQEVKYHGPGAEFDVLVAVRWRAPTPGLHATVRTANNSGIPAGVADRHCGALVFHSNVIIDPKSGSLRVSHFLETFFGQGLGDRYANLSAENFV